MAPDHFAAKSERERKLNSVIAFASSLTSRLEKPPEAALFANLQIHIRHLPLKFSPAVLAKCDELDKLGTELWNSSTRLRRDELAQEGKSRDDRTRRSNTISLLRAYAFLLLDSASMQAVKGRERKACTRLMKVALKAAKICIHGKELDSAIKILERAATYEDILCDDGTDGGDKEAGISRRLRVEYLALRAALAFRQDRLDTAEHMFVRCKQLDSSLAPDTAESIADLFYEIGKQALMNRSYEVAAKWLERAIDMLGDQDTGTLGPEAGELKLCLLQNLVEVHMKLNTSEATEKAWQLIKLMENDYGDKMVVFLSKLELLSASKSTDESEYYNVLTQMMRTIILNNTNFKTILHHIHRLKELSNVYACKALDGLLKTRLTREENALWIEKTIVTRIWASTTDTHSGDALEQLRQTFDTVLQESSFLLSASATHAAQMLLWKKVEETSSQEQHITAEAWCRLCLHPLLEKAGAQNKAKIIRKIVQSTASRQDYVAAREAFCTLPVTGKDEPVTRYLMYKVGLRTEDEDFAAECLDVVCRNSSKDATLLYACVMEAQSIGNKRQAVNALTRVLDKYDYATPAGVHLPALLRVTLRLLQSQLVRDGDLDHEILRQLCTIFEGACNQAKVSSRRPSTSKQQVFEESELEWFSKNSYNMSLKYCAEMPPQNLVKLLKVCTEFIWLLKEQQLPNATADLNLRLAFCEFLAACTYTTLARAEDDQEVHLQNYLEVRNHCQEFRRIAMETANELSGAAQDDILSKQLQIVKLELEAALKLKRWDDLDALFEQCWSCKSSDRYETLADLILVIHSCLVHAAIDTKYQNKVLSMLQKLINLSSRQNGNDVVRLSHWLRCLFKLTLTYDESISLKCLEQVTQIAANKFGVCSKQTVSLLLFLSIRVQPLSSRNLQPLSPVNLGDGMNSADERYKQADHYPATELEWMVTSSFNIAVDYYLSDNDARCVDWAQKAMVAAQWLEDDGKLRDLLMKKFSALQFDK